MKKILLFAILLSSLQALSQSKGYLRYDSLYIEKIGGNGELIIRNGSRNETGVLVNVGGGRTQFMRSRVSGDTLFIGKDTLTGIGSGGGGGGGGKFSRGSETIINDSTTVEGIYIFKADTAKLATITRAKYEAYKPINVAEYSTVMDNGQYAAFGWMAVRRDTAYAYIKVGPDHITPNRWVVMRSNNGMQSWDSISSYTGVNGSGISNLIATCIDDTIWVAWQTTAQNYLKIAYSIDGGRTHTISDSIATHAVPFGEFKKLPSGYKYFNYYEFGASYAVKWVRSATGTGWATVSTLISGTPGTHEYNETWIEVIDGTTDGNTRLIAIMRDEALGWGPLQLTSTDGGATWTQRGRVTPLMDSQERYAAPSSIMRVGDNLVIAKAQRVDRSGGGSEDDYHLATVQGLIDSVFTDTSKWSRPTKIYNSRANYAGMPNDFGYSNLFTLGGQPRMIAYDVSNKNVGGGSVYATRVFTMPVYTPAYLRMESTVIQSIPASTETTVAFGYKALDSDNLYNSDSGFVIIKKDGMYSIKSRVTWAASNSGTYRQASMKVVNSAVNNNESNKVIANSVIQPSTELRYSEQNLSAEVFLRQGEKVLVTVMHDHTSAISLGSNTLYSTLQATLEIKQLK